MSVCANQDVFNVAVRKALKENEKEAMKKIGSWVYVYVVLWLVFFVWGVILAMQISDHTERVEHILFALVFGPIYVIAYYLGGYKGKKGRSARMGMCGGGHDE